MNSVYVITSIAVGRYNETVLIHGVASDEVEVEKILDEKKTNATTGMCVTKIPLDKYISPKMGYETFHENPNW